MISKLGLEKGALHADHHFSYALSNDAADITAVNIVSGNGGYVFDVKNRNEIVENVNLNMGGCIIGKCDCCYSCSYTTGH